MTREEEVGGQERYDDEQRECSCDIGRRHFEFVVYEMNRLRTTVKADIASSGESHNIPMHTLLQTPMLPPELVW